ncbi:ABC-2 type transport system permease protein [Paenibacillus amylolyticus]|uniref:ABC-2 type transport system permease protein n=1 Tax=Paenibacillus amylolyticus TaxID=1451 RepID=A0AAP5H1K6_PAEAM|nr:ABC transporter permease [Paenibacillus amylolyticus]MDR6724560.1 ABC-2 type transport system permease protein [Paenibacillus amylolyticus]
MNKMGTITGFTFKNKVKTKSFMVTTIVLAILITIGLNVPYFITLFNGGSIGGGASGNHPVNIGLLTSGQPEVSEKLESFSSAQGDQAYRFIAGGDKDEAALKADTEAGLTDGYLKFEAVAGQEFPQPILYSSDEVSPQIIASIEAALQSVKLDVVVKDVLTAEQKELITTPVKLTQESLSAEEGAAGAESDNGMSPINYIVVYLLIILLFTSTMMTGNMIASEITAEKSSRIMEILITSVSPLSQMFGKIIGIFLVGILQIGIFGAVVAANMLLPHNVDVLGDFNMNLSDINTAVIVYGLIFYILGYFLYAVMFAAIGSMVSRTEELGQAVLPITMLSLVSFYIAIFSIATPNILLLKVASFIPFTSPTAILVRIGAGVAPTWEILTSLVILAVSILIFGWLAAKIYRTGVLMYGKRPTFKELFKAMKAYKI